MARRAIIPIFIPFAGCPVRCVYCNQHRITAVSNPLSEEEVQKAISMKLRQAKALKPEVAFYGGTFTMMDREEQDNYLRAVAPLLEAGYVDSVRISTRPEHLTEEDFKRLHAGGVRTIEFGIQSTDGSVLKASGRGVSFEMMEETVRRAEDFGFIIGLQQMIGLPKDSLEKDLETARWMANYADFVRIYPTVVFKETSLYDAYRIGRYRPLSLASAIAISAQLLDFYEASDIPVIRVGLPKMEREDYVAGPYHDNFREFAESKRLIDRLIASEDAIARITASPEVINRIAGPFGYGRRRLEKVYGKVRLVTTKEKQGDLSMRIER